jgi:hypothetical protein
MAPVGNVTQQGERINVLNESPVGNVKPDAKEVHAGYIARVIVWTFAGAVAALILLIYWVVMNYPWIDARPTGEKGEIVYRAVELLTKAAAPALKEFGTFLSTVFGSLLAFILGYYFGEKKKDA